MAIQRDFKGNSLLIATDDYVVVDLETTGISPARDCIIEIGAVRVEHGTVTAEAKGIHIQPLDHRFPLADMDTGICHDRLAVAHDGDVRSRAAHVDDHGIAFIGDRTAADNAGRRTA